MFRLLHLVTTCYTNILILYGIRYQNTDEDFHNKIIYVYRNQSSEVIGLNLEESLPSASQDFFPSLGSYGKKACSLDDNSICMRSEGF